MLLGSNFRSTWQHTVLLTKLNTIVHISLCVWCFFVHFVGQNNTVCHLAIHMMACRNKDKLSGAKCPSYIGYKIAASKYYFIQNKMNTVKFTTAACFLKYSDPHFLSWHGYHARLIGTCFQYPPGHMYYGQKMK